MVTASRNLRAPVLSLVLLLLPGGLSAQGVSSGGNPPETEEGSAPEANTQGQVFLGAFKAIQDFHQTTFSDSILWEHALEGLIQGLNDPYAEVFTPEEYGAFEEDNTGDYAGIGVQITRLKERVTITAVFRQTPADEAGLIVGDRIVGVGGNNAREWSVDQARDSIRGEVGTVVQVTVARDGLPEPMTIPIRRDQVHVSAVTAFMTEEELGYILVDRVARGSAAELDSAFVVLKDARGIVLDLRRNPGGYLVESLNMADLFLPRGETLASTRSRTPREPNGLSQEAYRGRLQPRIPDKPIVVLVDEYTASAAEIVAGALQDHDRAVVLGSRTFGKGVVQTILPLPGSRRIRITTGDWNTPLGRSLHIPRDMQGRPLAHDTTEQRVVTTAGGRTLRADGGVFPDLEVADDTLSTVEQNFLIESAKAGVPLTLRITEVSFEEAKRVMAGEGRAELNPDRLDQFMEELREKGIPQEILDHPDSRSYLSWRAHMAFENRLDHKAHALEYQTTRDPVLAEALRLLADSGSQSELFAAVEAEARARATNADTADREIQGTQGLHW